MSGTGPGQGVTGFIANPDNPFDPINGYPTSNPTTGFTPKDEGFAGVIYGSPTDGSPALTLYCIDISTDTWGGIGYQLGTWSSAEVPNVGYVARILNSYYPAVPGQPAGLSESQKAAAVQAAIWFFSDRYVLNTGDSLHSTTAAIVAAALAAGPITQPPPPSVTITPTAASGPEGSVVGPFTVTSSTTGTAAVTATGGQMFSDAAGTTPIANGATVPSGQQIWLRSTGPQVAVLQATAHATVPSGNVYLYDGNTPGVDDAQKLILSQPAELTTTVKAAAEFLPTGSLVVEKTVAGPAAGHQGPVTIVVECGGIVLSPAFSIDAGAPAGTSSHTYSNIPAGSTCTVDETHDGHTSAVTVTVTGDGQQVTIPSGSSVTAKITDTYDYVPGQLVVNKSIAGPGTGLQGEVVIRPTCSGTALPAFTIPAGAPAGERSKTYDNIAAGSVCTINETSNGQNSAVTVTVTGNGQQVTVPAGDVVDADLTDTYALNPGSLVVDKTIAGSGAGLQGPITINVTCVADGVTTTLSPFNIPAGATGTPSHTYTGIAGNSVCTIVVTDDGSINGTVGVSEKGSGIEVVVPPGGSVTAALTDTYSTGDLIVNKTIDGDAAGHQGAVTIHTVCGTTALPDFVIPAGTPAGTASRSYPGVALAGTTCTVTETVDGSSSTVTVQTSGSPQTVTITGNDSATATVTDTYTFVPGSLTVNKTISGASAGSQGPVTIQVDCGEQVATPDFTIPAGATGPQSHTYTGIPANTACTVTETANGSTSTVSVTTTGSPQDVTIPAGGTATAGITDTYSPTPGSLLVRKTITGPTAGQQGPVTIAVSCGGSALPSFVIPAGTKAGTVSHAFDGIPAGSACTVDETSDGGTATVMVTVEGATQQVTVPAGGVVSATITDTYTDTPGSFRVTKTLAGAGAGKQGRIGILVLCGGPVHIYAFLIPAGTAAGDVTRVFNGIPAGSTCAALEVVNGHNDAVTVATAGNGQRVTVPAAATVSAHITDTFTAVVPITPITPITPILPATGPSAPVPGLLGFAGLAILVGTGLVLVARRPRPDR